MQEVNQSEMSIPGQVPVLIVGAGLTGSLTASLLRRKFQNIDLTVWEKSRGAGGRMTTSRCPDDPKCTADTGAQYISATPSYFKSHERYSI
jgi:renalase